MKATKNKDNTIVHSSNSISKDDSILNKEGQPLVFNGGILSSIQCFFADTNKERGDFASIAASLAAK